MRYKLTLLAGVASLALAVGSAPALASPCIDTTGSGGISAGCQYLITIGQTGAITLSNQIAANGPNYDGSEDVQVGVIDSYAGGTITGLHLTGSSIGNFDSDGIDAYGGVGNAMDTTGYGGPNTYFANNTINALDAMFVTPLSNGDTTYFSLEEPPTTGSGQLTVTPVSVPEPSGFVLLFTALLGLFAFRKWAASRS